MKKRRLGDLEVSAIGLGCMGFSHAYGTAVEKKEAVQKIRAAYDLGYNFFDTAECYIGQNLDGSISYNEEIVGRALADIRSQVVIATKFGVRHQGDTLLADSSPATIRKSVDSSLKRLGVEYIDLCYQHRIDPKTEPEEVAAVMAELIKDGKIRYWGISEANEEYLRRAYAVCPVTAIENRYSMMARWYEALFLTLEELNIGFVAFSPMANGFLTGKYTKNSKFAKGDFRSEMPQYTEEGMAAGAELMKIVSKLAAEKGATDAQISLAWMMNKKPWIVPIPGSRKIERMKENAESADIMLTISEIEHIDQALSKMELPVFGGHHIEK
ncbi:aldo/keto reductase [Pectinatus haikarae]|uniref:Aryl-alcohol dehydrogenase-like predicted oxidoreductase n=1 Tax=Pectinatus haikarae TaxID=349096 RepID=A0ABT9Y980_9FIRM|nr:aldo/keto reductase [Pectinatus haikarae]MDQ0204400.1 aryl-alcohol dehydrogenase-like predicted oxidoreductase [Pectinatus haikarae]